MGRLLIVGDEPDLLALLAQWLTAAGHSVAAADSAKTALVLVDRHGSPDEAIPDVAMPGTDGFDLMEQPRGRAPQLSLAF